MFESAQVCVLSETTTHSCKVYTSIQVNTPFSLKMSAKCCKYNKRLSNFNKKKENNYAHSIIFFESVEIHEHYTILR